MAVLACRLDGVLPMSPWSELTFRGGTRADPEARESLWTLSLIGLQSERRSDLRIPVLDKREKREKEAYLSGQLGARRLT